MILVVDNRDSFVWNLASYAGLRTSVEVVPNTMDAREALDRQPEGIIISPGPGSPETPSCVGSVPDILKRSSCPVLGVCLGHQAMAHTFGGAVTRTAPVHGKESSVFHDGKGIFAGVPSPLRAGRYHSLVVARVPLGFTVSALTGDGLVMGMRSDDGRLEGVQFHPESILTGFAEGWGRRIIDNFIAACGVSL
ncbi:MAG: aminodeoxychorismate/anthranilate synthase component II [Candidatus Methanofastidiosa archaeon]|nr:aminodeoxychorismate/anthranilate synthase component II [Candidatus Methanofastidiosa archaeon]